MSMGMIWHVVKLSKEVLSNNTGKNPKIYWPFADFKGNKQVVVGRTVNSKNMFVKGKLWSTA